MTIVHVGQLKLAFSNGVQAAIWSLARAQGQHGHDVTVLSLGRKVQEHEVAAARRNGIRLWGTNTSIVFSRSTFEQVKALLGEIQPDVVHLHSSFIPAHNYLAHYLRGRSIDYVVSPHGNLCPRERARKPVRKSVYSTLFEKPMLRRAQAAVCVSEQESDDLDRYVSRVSTAVVPNIVDLDVAEAAHRRRAGRSVRPRPKGLFLGKSDVVNKGLDLLFDVAPRLSADLDIHVIRRDKEAMWREFQRLVATKKPPNLQVHEPVYGEDKAAALAAADFYIHMARWEVFGLSIMEALASGLPVVVSERCYLAEAIVESGGGIAVPLAPGEAADQVERYLADPTRMREDGERGRAWVLRHFSPEAVVQRSIDAYNATTH